jgi:acetyltransferase-like isoleucine patch superfamily enzyme
MISDNPLVSWFLRRLDGALAASRSREQRKRFTEQANFDSTVVFGPTAAILNARVSPDAICIGSHAVINGELVTNCHGGKIQLGSYVFVGPGSRIWSAVSIKIGNYALISHNVNIHDNDSHSLHLPIRREHTKFILDNGRLPPSAYDADEAPVVIEDDVWICFNATILKGVRIGRGAIVAAGSVVTKDVEPFTLVAGNPAVVKRKLEQYS